MRGRWWVFLALVASAVACSSDVTAPKPEPYNWPVVYPLYALANVAGKDLPQVIERNGVDWALYANADTVAFSPNAYTVWGAGVVKYDRQTFPQQWQATGTWFVSHDTLSTVAENGTVYTYRVHGDTLTELYSPLLRLEFVRVRQQ